MDKWIEETMALLRDYDRQKDRLEEKIAEAKQELADIEHKIENAKELIKEYKEKKGV